MAYPTDLDNFTDPIATEVLGTAGGGIGVAAIFTNIHTAAEALEAKVGIGSSTPSAGKVLRATGTGTSAWGAIVNADIDAAAAIAYSKLNLATSIVNADISASAAIAQSKLAGNILSFASVTANQGSITTAVDLTGLTVTVTVPAGGRYVMLTATTAFQSTAADDYAGLLLLEGATQLQAATTVLRTIGINSTITLTHVLLPSAAAHTYKLQGVRSNGSGTLTMVASATAPATLAAILI